MAAVCAILADLQTGPSASVGPTAVNPGCRKSPERQFPKQNGHMQSGACRTTVGGDAAGAIRRACCVCRPRLDHAPGPADRTMRRIERTCDMDPA